MCSCYSKLISETGLEADVFTCMFKIWKSLYLIFAAFISNCHGYILRLITNIIIYGLVAYVC